MSPNEAAGLLGVSPTATRDEVQNAYELRAAEARSDAQRLDALAAARDALLAASAWQAPGGSVQPPAPPHAPTADTQATLPYPVSGPQAPNSQAPNPQAPGPQGVGPQRVSTPDGTSPQQYAQQQPPYAQQQPPYAQQQPPYAQQPSYAQQPPYAQNPYPQAASGPGGQPGPWYPPATPRRRLSTGAIVGITLGGVAAALVILLVAVFAIGSIAGSAGRVSESEAGSTAAPYDDPSDGASDDPSGTPSDEPSDGSSGGSPDGSEVDDYDVDGVHVHYVDGWTFELTPGQTCAGATVTASFADTPDGDTLSVWDTSVDLKAGVPYELTIPDDASVYDYAGIESIVCGQA